MSYQQVLNGTSETTSECPLYEGQRYSPVPTNTILIYKNQNYIFLAPLRGPQREWDFLSMQRRVGPNKVGYYGLLQPFISKSGIVKEL